MDHLSSLVRPSSGCAGFWPWHDFVVGVTALFIVSTLLGINYITTVVINLRTQGMSLPVCPANMGILFTAIIGLLSFPVLFAALLLILTAVLHQFFLSDIYIAGEVPFHVGGSPICSSTCSGSLAIRGLYRFVACTRHHI